jgi:hypothetical protein
VTSGRERNLLCGVGLVALVTGAWHVWVASQQTWVIDDWVYLDRVQTRGFVEYLFQDYNGHVMPGEFLLTWVLTKLFPLSFTPVVVVVGALSVGAVVTWGMALRELFGPQLRQLLPLAVLSLTPVSLWPSAFWASAVQVLPLLLLTGLALYFATRTAGGVRGAGWRLCLTYVVALFFWEKALLMLIPVAGVLLLILGRRIWQRRTLLVSLAVVSVVYLVLYAALRTDAVEAQPVSWVNEPDASFPVRVLHFLDYALDVFMDLLVPALYGGPWGSIPIVNDLEHWPSAYVSRGLTVLTLALIGAALLVRRRAWIPVTMTLGYAVVAASLILFSVKYAVLGPYALYEDRYFTDLIPVALLGVSMVISPTRAEAEAGAAVYRRSVPLRAQRAARLLSFAVVLAVAVSLVSSNVMQWQRIGPNPARNWVNNLRADVVSADGASVLDARPPEDVFSSAFPEQAVLSRMVAPLGDRLRFNSPGRPMLLVDSRGHLVPAAVEPSMVSTAGPQPDCGYLVTGGRTVDVVMPAPLFPYEWGVQVDLFSGGGGRLDVEIDGVTQSVRIPVGLSSTQLVHQGTVGSVRVTMPGTDASACVTRVVAGRLVADGTAGPRG